MSLLFRSLRSGSSGNSVLVCAQGRALLIDLGLPVRTALKEILGELRQRGIKLVGALVTHEHSDHFAPGPLRAMAGLGVPVHAPKGAIAHACEQIGLGFWSGRPEFVPLDEGEQWERAFEIGPFSVQPIEVGHAPGTSCFAFRITVEGRNGPISMIHATDLCDLRGLPGYMPDADLIYVECNHDPELLRLRPNPASHFHLENSRCGKLLAETRQKSQRPPKHVILGHLSEQRNTPTLAGEAVRKAMSNQQLELDFPVACAPRHHPGTWIEVV
jgi:ribonuclease BN (tRNA processing enzyme)